MSLRYGPGDARNKDDDNDLGRSTLVSPQRTIPQVINALHQMISGQLLARPIQENRLTRVQALQERKPDDLAAATRIAKRQANTLLKVHTLDEEFEAKRQLTEFFLTVVCSKIPENTLITPEAVQTALLALKAQFEAKYKARELANSASEKMAITAKEVARLEKESAAPKPAESSTAAKATGTSALDIAKHALEALKKAQEEASVVAEKPTDIPMEDRDAFLAFVTHALTVLPFIAQELQFAKPDDKLTQADVDAALKPWKPVVGGNIAKRFASYEPWRSILDDKTQRLKDVEKEGGVFKGFQARVAEWYKEKEMPKAMSTEEMHARKKIGRKLEQDADIEDITDILQETPKERKIRRELIDGTRRKQIEEIAVAKSKAPKEKIKTVPVAKQPHEVEDSLRAEFKKLGIKPFSKGEQNPLAAIWRAGVGSECWNTAFEDEVSAKSPSPPRRVMLDKDVPLAFPERKKAAILAVTPALEKHLQTGVKKGYLVGKIKDAKKDKYWEPVADTPELTEITATLERMKI